MFSFFYPWKTLSFLYKIHNLLQKTLSCGWCKSPPLSNLFTRNKIIIISFFSLLSATISIEAYWILLFQVTLFPQMSLYYLPYVFLFFIWICSYDYDINLVILLICCVFHVLFGFCKKNTAIPCSVLFRIIWLAMRVGLSFPNHFQFQLISPLPLHYVLMISLSSMPLFLPFPQSVSLTKYSLCSCVLPCFGLTIMVLFVERNVCFWWVLAYFCLFFFTFSHQLFWDSLLYPTTELFFFMFIYTFMFV